MATSEQLKNVYTTTLSAGYTSGAGSISVTSAGSYVNGGPFTLTILDQTTGAFKLMFRVTSVSGTTFTGAAEGTDANAASGDTVIGSMVTVASLDQLLGLDNGPLYPMSDPKLQSWSWINQGSATLDTSNRGIGISNPTTENGFHVHARVFAVPATPYHVEFALTMRRHNDTNLLTGVCFADGGSGTPKMMIIGRYQIADQIVQFYASSPTVYGSSTPINNTVDTVGNTLIFIRLGDDGANRTYDISHDGYDWFQLGTEGNTSQFTATHLGIMVNSGPQSLRCYSVRITA